MKALIVHRHGPLTGGQGVRVVYDGVGGALLEKSLGVLQVRGRLVVFGQAGGAPPLLDSSRLSGITGAPGRGSLSVAWASVNDYLVTAAHRRACAEAVFDGLLRGALHLHIAEMFPLERAAQAHRMLESGATSGKLLLQVA